MWLNVSVLRTLTGHKSSVKSLDFHPYGDYAASGSQDSTIKVFLRSLYMYIYLQGKKKAWLLAWYTYITLFHALKFWSFVREHTIVLTLTVFKHTMSKLWDRPIIISWC